MQNEYNYLIRIAEMLEEMEKHTTAIKMARILIASFMKNELFLWTE